MAAYDRQKILQAAARAHAKKRSRKAISLYRRVLAVEPSNGELHAKIAPLLARRRERFDAWLSFRAAAQGMLRTGKPERAMAVFTEAARYVPDEVESWVSLAKLQRNQGQAQQAIKTLTRGLRHFRSRRQRSQAVYLLRQVREIEPWNLDAVLELARRLGKMDQRDEADILLCTLARRVSGRKLRRVRSAQWRLRPTPSHSWLVIKAAFSTEVPPRRSRAGARTAARARD